MTVSWKSWALWIAAAYLVLCFGWLACDYVYVRFEPAGGGALSTCIIWLTMTASVLIATVGTWRLAPLESTLAKLATLAGVVIGGGVVYAIFFITIGWSFHFWIGGGT